MTGLTEAAKSRTPLVVLAADTAAAALRSNFRIDQDELVRAVGAVPERLHGPATAVADASARLPASTGRAPAGRADDAARRSGSRLSRGRRLPPEPPALHPVRPSASRYRRGCRRPGPSPASVDHGRARRRAGRCARAAGTARRSARGAAGDVGGGQRTVRRQPVGAGHLRRLRLAGRGRADRAGRRRAERRRGAEHVDDAPRSAARAHGDGDPGRPRRRRHRRAPPGRPGGGRRRGRGRPSVDRRSGADAARPASGWRTPGRRRADPGRHLERHACTRTPARDAQIDPRILSAALDGLLPEERTVAIDSGHFMGYPAMYLRVPDAQGFVFTQAFQAVGLGLATAIGAAVARPDRLTVAALGDGGAMMALPELETVARLGPADADRGLQRRGLRRRGPSLRAARRPARSGALPGRGLRGAGAGGRPGRRHDPPPRRPGRRDGLARRGRDAGLVLDAKVVPTVVAEWLEEAFRGH